MLCQFTFRNFKSYKDETVFDFQATAIPEFSDSLLLSEKGSSLLPVGVIYGPNGGGKSNVLSALACLISTVVSPIYNLKRYRLNTIIQQEKKCIPFLFDEESKKEPTEFEVFFREGTTEYRYNIALLNNEIYSEKLYWRAIGGKKTGVVFEREQQNISLGQSISRKNINTSVNPKMPYLSFLAINYDIPIIVEVQHWFESCIICDYANPVVERTLMHSDEDKNNVIKALNDVGVDLTGYRFDESEKELYTQRNIDGKTYELSYFEESEGTKKLIAALPVIIEVLKEGRLFIADELDAKLHPKLLKYVISLFKNKNVNTKGAQLLFTSHDMTTMNNTIFRRDEIWFAAANEKHESEIYSLYEIRREDNERVNNTAAYNKQYLEGRYGADPYLTNMLNGGDWL